MDKEKKDNQKDKQKAGPGPKQSPAAAKGGKTGGSVYAQKRKKPMARSERPQDEFDQRIVDLARVTRVMAGGKRMRFRATVVIGNKKGKIGVGVAKGADVTMAVTKAVNVAKKNLIDVPIVNETIPHEISEKFGAAKVMLKPARRGRGVIAGGAVRIALELAGVKNVTSKILGSNNKVNIAKCTIKALDNLKKVEVANSKKKQEKKGEEKKNDKDLKKTSSVEIKADKK
jgi:small subunit ribosomal protein S5